MSASRARRIRVVLESVSRQEREKTPVVAIKIGGSLLSFPQLLERIEWLLEQRAGSHVMLICGGGQAADMVRSWQQWHGISDRQAHHLALAGMAFHERLLQSALPNSRLVENLVDLENAWNDGVRPILQAGAFIDEMDLLLDEPLPATWEMTSDSIAAWCGHFAGADELILAKSTDLPGNCSFASAREAGLVDAAFGGQRCPQSVGWVNLRAERPRLVDWQSVPALKVGPAH